MSLWHKPTAEIRWEDVVEFCAAGWAEGVRVDYKRQMPATGVAKHVAAFANTLGGLLLIGVDANRTTGKPITPITGMTLTRGITEQIDLQCLDGIYPAVMPDTVVIENPATAGTGVVLVRVDESVQAPHAIQNSKEVYIRTGDHSRPEDLASLPVIEHLLQRRTAPEAMRKAMREAALRRVRTGSEQYPLMTISISPTYPSRPLQPERTVLEWALSGRYSSGGDNLIQPCAGGVYQIRRGSVGVAGARIVTTYMELMNSGFVFFEEVAPTGQGDGRTTAQRWIDQKQLLYFIFMALADATAFMSKLGYAGTATVTLELLDVAGWGIHLNGGRFPPDPTPAVSRDPTVLAEITVATPLLFSKETVRALVNQVRWAMGYERESNETSIYDGLMSDTAPRAR